MRKKVWMAAVLLAAAAAAAIGQDKPTQPATTQPATATGETADSPTTATSGPSSDAKVDPKDDPLAVLVAALKDDKLCPPTLLALRATDDKDLLPVFEAFSRSGDKTLRLFATTAMAQIGGKDASAALHERLRDDPAMVVRCEAMIHLMTINLLSDDDLRAATKMDDESIQCISARALVQRGRAKDAAATLERLAKSKDEATACMAGLSLLGVAADDARHAVLMEKIRNPKTSEEVIGLLMEQIAEAKIARARDLAEAVLAAEVSPVLKVRAYRALTAISTGADVPSAAKQTDARDLLAKAIERSDNVVLRTHLVKLLSEQKHSDEALARLAKADQTDVGGVLARLELARRAGDADKLTEALGRSSRWAIRW